MMSDREFGSLIMRLIQKGDMTRDETREAFYTILKDQTTEMQQGAFLAALTSKGETAEEAAGAWEAIYNLDTEKVVINSQGPLIENCGTGMDGFKTFNISTAASIIAAAGGIYMARHGARAITSVCGTVDLAEALGVDVECDVRVVARSIEKTGLGLFNGMSPKVHPNALRRILSKIFFGSILNIAASLANPAMPKRAVRGVYAKGILRPVAEVMKAIGYERALVVYGGMDGSDKGMDEASVCGPTFCAELGKDGKITEYSFLPDECGLDRGDPERLSPSSDIEQEARSFVSLIRGRGDAARTDAAILNAGLIYYVADMADSISDGVQKAFAALNSGEAYDTLEKWVSAQNTDPGKGRERLRSFV